MQAVRGVGRVFAGGKRAVLRLADRPIIVVIAGQLGQSFRDWLQPELLDELLQVLLVQHLDVVVFHVDVHDLRMCVVVWCKFAKLHSTVPTTHFHIVVVSSRYLLCSNS